MVHRGRIPSNMNALSQTRSQTSCSDVIFPLFIEPEELEQNGRFSNPELSRSKTGHSAVMKVSLKSETVNLYDSQKDHYSKSMKIIQTVGENLGVAMQKAKH